MGGTSKHSSEWLRRTLLSPATRHVGLLTWVTTSSGVSRKMAQRSLRTRMISPKSTSLNDSMLSHSVTRMQTEGNARSMINDAWSGADRMDLRPRHTTQAAQSSKHSRGVPLLVVMTGDYLSGVVFVALLY